MKEGMVKKTKPQSIFDHVHSSQKLLHHYRHAKNQLNTTSFHSSNTANFRVPSPKWSRPFLTKPNTKTTEATFSFPKFVTACKKS